MTPLEHYTSDDLDRIRRAAPAPVVIGRYVRLRKQGKDFVGLCPFHKEKTPSFRAHPGYYKCFGCGAAGDIFRFIERIEGIPFPKAVRKLADICGISLDARPVPFPARQRGDLLSDRVAKEATLWRSQIRDELEDVKQSAIEAETSGAPDALAALESAAGLHYRITTATGADLIQAFLAFRSAHPADAARMIRERSEFEAGLVREFMAASRSDPPPAALSPSDRKAHPAS